MMERTVRLSVISSYKITEILCLQMTSIMVFSPTTSFSLLPLLLYACSKIFLCFFLCLLFLIGVVGDVAYYLNCIVHYITSSGPRALTLHVKKIVQDNCDIHFEGILRSSAPVLCLWARSNWSEENIFL